MGSFDHILQQGAAAEPPPVSGGAFDHILKPVAPAGPPSVPISGPQSHEAALAGPSVPISQGNIDTRGLPEDEGVAAERQKNSRVQAIADALRAKENPTGVADFVADKFSLGTTRAPTALANALLMRLQGKNPDASFGELYQGSDRYMNDRMARAEENTGPLAPAVGAIASIPASMALSGVGRTTAASPVNVAGRTNAPASTLKVAADAAKPGFVEGAASNAETLDDAVKGGVTNAALSAVTAGAVDQGVKTLSPAGRSAAAAEATANRGRAPDEIRTEIKGLYDQLDNQGISFSSGQTIGLHDALRNLRNDNVYLPGNQQLDAVYNDLVSGSRRVQGMTFNQLDNARSALATQARGGDEQSRVSARAVINEIDRLINSGPPAINPTGADIGPIYQRARTGAREKAMVEDAMFHSDNVDRKALINSATDPNKAMKQEFGNVQKQYSRPGAYDPFANDPTGRDLLAKIVEGGTVQNAMGSLGSAASGRFAPFAAGAAGIAAPLAVGMSKEANPLLTAGLSAMGGLAAGGSVNQFGRMLNRGAASMGREDVDALMRHITNSPRPIPGAAISRDDLVKILAGQDLARVAPRFGSALIGNQQEERQ